ncbi:MAG: hypothetical protein AAB922_02125 [Patescibacteria group bacterium]
MENKAINKKLVQFNEELKELCDRYQYELTVSLNYLKAGITPSLSVKEVAPPKKEKETPPLTKKKK